MIYNIPEKYKELTLTATSYNRKVAVEIPRDSDANEVFEAFKTIMIGLTFHEKSFDRAVADYYHEHNLNTHE